MKYDWPKIQTVIMALSLLALFVGVLIQYRSDVATLYAKMEGLTLMVNSKAENLQHSLDGVQSTVTAILLMQKHGTDHAEVDPLH